MKKVVILLHQYRIKLIKIKSSLEDIIFIILSTINYFLEESSVKIINTFKFNPLKI